MYGIKINSNSVGYEIRVKKHWWSRWKTIRFEGNSLNALETANGLLFNEHKRKHGKKNNVKSNSMDS